ncbi:MAG: cysteine desulfurase [Bacteroidetes bacterium]|nr:cysteine desulfurase [Bacteroidota bacterium]
MDRIYLDHTATTPLAPSVLEAMQPYLTGEFGNASSAHWFGRKAKDALEGARNRIARAIGAKPSELFFTSGGTEANNLAIQGALRAARKRGKTHLISEAAEHHAVLDTCEYMRDEGFSVTVLEVDAEGRLSPESVERALQPGTALVSVMHANNEVGTIQPVKEISRITVGRGVPVHTDAVQSVGKIPVDVEDLGVQLLTLSAHKIYGPKGIGALYVRQGTAWEPVFHGGGQERGKRPGTENVASAVGFAAAVELVLEEREREMQRLQLLRDALQRELRAAFPRILVNGHPDFRLPHLLSVSFDAGAMPMEGEMLVTNMDLEGVAVSSGSACTSGSVQPSHVLLAMGRDPGTAKATLRFSFGRGNSQEELPIVAGIVRQVVERMTKVTRK